MSSEIVFADHVLIFDEHTLFGSRELRGGVQFSGDDFGSSLSGGADILGVPSLFIEAKRVERLNFHDAMRQAETNIEKTQSDDVAIVMNRKNRMKTGDSLCLLRLDDFLVFYNAFLREKGFAKDEGEDETLSTLQ